MRLHLRGNSNLEANIIRLCIALSSDLARSTIEPSLPPSHLPSRGWEAGVHQSEAQSFVPLAEGRTQYLMCKVITVWGETSGRFCC